MSFADAEGLLALANMVAAHRHGVTINQVRERFGVCHRTAQRRMRALEGAFDGVASHMGEDGRKRWTLPVASISSHLRVTSEELLALDLAIKTTSEAGGDVETLRSIRDKVMTLVPPGKAASMEVDHDALLEAQGFVTRPGPRPRHDRETEAVIGQALKGCLALSFEYASGPGRKPTSRRVRPLGLRLGARRYLVALSDNDEATTIKTYRVDRMTAVATTTQVFARPVWFDLSRYCRRAFGAFENAAEHGPVAWRFSPEAAQVARDYVFHPDQVIEEQKDGAIVIRFEASGHLEMAWYLYTWGVHVEVLEPTALRDLVHAYRRSDFPSLP